MTAILVADDQELVRTGFRVVLQSEPGLEVVGEAADGAEAVDLAAALRPDVVLMDVRMPVLDGIEATRRIRAAVGEDARPRVLVMTTFDLDEHVYGALRAGASGFLLKDVRAAQLVEAVRTVAAGDALISPSVTKRLVAEFAARPLPAERPAGLDELTPRELEVLRLIARGLSNGEIAAHLVVGEATVKTHVTRILMKLDLRDRVQAVVLAYETGLVRPGG
ncbi:MAG TPA: response regulator transcription factor [Gaiellaceae bacterium]|nr:response regulator transcription factor [Gaiellaceae bacterium]